MIRTSVSPLIDKFEDTLRDTEDSSYKWTVKLQNAAGDDCLVEKATFASALHLMWELDLDEDEGDRTALGA